MDIMRHLFFRSLHRPFILHSMLPRFAKLHHWADQTTRILGHTDSRAQIHERLVVITGLPMWQIFVGKLPQNFFTCRGIDRYSDIKNTGIDALDISIESRDVHAKRDRGDRAKSVTPDPG